MRASTSCVGVGCTCAGAVLVDRGHRATRAVEDRTSSWLAWFAFVLAAGLVVNVWVLSAPAHRVDQLAFVRSVLLIAMVATLLYKEVVDFKLIVIGIIIGSVIGGVWAQKVQMTGMPELVALFNGFGGLASVFVGWAEFEFGKQTDVVTQIAIYSAILIGGVTFTGSFIAYLKLAGKMSGRPTLFPAQKAINAVIFVLLVILGVVYVMQD